MPVVHQSQNMSGIDRTANMENPNLQMELLQLAGRSLDMKIVSDVSTSSFIETTGAAAQNGPTVSGLNDFDYQSLAGLVMGHQNLSQLKTIGKIPLPPEVMEHFGHIQCHCTMGLFPEINRAWLTIDSDIYVWAYEHGTDVAYFDGIGETIVSVGLIKPKSGVFQNFVKYLLILTTTVEIVVLGVTFSSSANNGPLGTLEEMHLVPEPVFVLPTDGISMTVIQSTNSGRIFMGGKDGCLYEITYQAQLGWFGKHCKKVNHSTGTLSFLVPSFLNAALYEDDPICRIEVDNSRHILFTLSEKGNIEVFDLGDKGDSIKKVIKLTQSKIVSAATDIVKTLESANFRPIIAISAIEETESQYLNLVAITQCGVRLYFSAGCVFMSNTGPVTQRPWCLSLLHVRLPPGFAANAPTMRPKQVHTATYSNGTALMISSPTADNELLWCLSGGAVSSAPGSSPREAAALLSLDGPAWALRRAAPPLSNLSPALQRICEPSVISQHMSGPIKWIVLTGTGAHIIQQLQPVDLLRQLLVDGQGPECAQVKAFFLMQREDQACASCLVLACSSRSGQDQITEWATRAYFLYGGQPTLLQTPNINYSNSPQFSPRQVSTPMVGRSAANVHQSLQAALQSPGQGVMQSVPGHPLSPINQTNVINQHPTNQQNAFQPLGGQDSANFLTIQFSPKHEGLYIYVGRILRPVWQMKCVTKSTVDDRDFLSSTITSSDCSSVLQHLYGVRAFLERNSVGSSNNLLGKITSMLSLHDSNLNNTRQEDVFLKEKKSLDALRIFINCSCEMLSLWKILCEHQFHVIAACLPPEQQAALLAASFRELLLGGQEVAGLLILSLINQYLSDNASVDSISSELREVCPSLYRTEDAACSKANEILLFAKQQTNLVEKEEMLGNALKLCKDVAPHVNLPVVCAKFSQAGFYKGVVDLCVVCADKIDPSKTGLYFYTNNQPNHDQEGYLAFYKRMDIYREVTSVLEQLFEQSSSGMQSEVASINNTTSPKTSQNSAQDLPCLSPADANHQARKLVMECLSYPDELLHVAVYEWMLTKQLYGELIALSEPSLETFLIKTSQTHPEAINVYDLLWKYYEKCGNHAAAARILNDLASKPSGGMKLTQRVNWLSRAVVCLRGGAGASPITGRFLRELEDKAEVARLQKLVLNAVQRLDRVPPPALQRLETQLLDITQLYEEYADQYNLWECKLAIVHCSGHNDPLLVESIWTNIIQQELDNMRNVVSKDDKMNRLLGKVSALGREYVSSGHCFPLSFILKQLELQGCKLGVNPGAVSKALLDINVPLEQLIDIYTRLIGLNERIWLSEGNELHLIEAAAILMDDFLSNTVPISANLRRRVLIKCQDLVSSSLNALYTKPDTEELVRLLKGMQTRLDRWE